MQKVKNKEKKIQPLKSLLPSSKKMYGGAMAEYFFKKYVCLGAIVKDDRCQRGMGMGARKHSR